MIISVSIVDKHKPLGSNHVGTYTFEIDYPSDAHVDLFVIECPPEGEAGIQPWVGRLITREIAKAEGLDACNGLGEDEAP